jgi:hypothetical protein
MDQQYAAARRVSSRPRARGGGGAPRWLGPLTRFPLLLGGICGLAICLAGGLVLTAIQGGARPSLPAPDGTARAICADLLARDYAKLYGLLSVAQRANGTEAEFAASQRRLDIAAGSVTRCAASVATTASGQAQAQITLARGGAATSSGMCALIYGDGDWRLDAYDPAVI